MDGSVQGNLHADRASAYKANRFKGSWAIGCESFLVYKRSTGLAMTPVYRVRVITAG
jgi:hypothetical protein